MTALTPQNADRKWVLQHLEEYAEHWQERLGLTNTRTLVMRAAAYQIRDLEAEVERLRAALATQEAAIREEELAKRDDREADCERLEAEVKRLRAALRCALGQDKAREGDMRDAADRCLHAEEVERLRAIVDRLPKTADGVPVVPLRSTAVYRITHGGLHIQESCDWSGEHPMFRAGDDGEPTSGRVMLPCGRCYSTREAAEAARNQVRGE